MNGLWSAARKRLLAALASRTAKPVLLGFAVILCVAVLDDRQEAQNAPLFFESFTRPDGLITNEWAYRNPGSPSGARSADWETTSGSLFADNGAGWTGVADRIHPDAGSTNGNDSCVFRLVTRRGDFHNVEVAFGLLNEGLTSGADLPPVAWDGVHVFLRYVSQYNLYYASINRRDNTVILKKKVPGGPSNDGTYYNLSSYRAFSVPYGSWVNVRATVVDDAAGSVTIRLFADGVELVSAVDTGAVGGAPIRSAGRVGIRGDNDSFRFDNFSVTELAGAPPAPAPPGPPPVMTLDLRSKQRLLSPGLADGINDEAVFGADAEDVSIFDVRGRRVFSATRAGPALLAWNGRDDAGRPVAAGVYIARIRRGTAEPAYQSLAVAK